MCCRAGRPFKGPVSDQGGEVLAGLRMRRFGTVAEVTPTAVLLALEDGAYYSGQTLGPNGGDVML